MAFRRSIMLLWARRSCGRCKTCWALTIRRKWKTHGLPFMGYCLRRPLTPPTPDLQANNSKDRVMKKLTQDEFNDVLQKDKNLYGVDLTKLNFSAQPDTDGKMKGTNLAGANLMLANLSG